MVPDYLAHLQTFFYANKQRYDFSTLKGCGTFTEDYLVELRKLNPRFGHLKKSGSQTQWNGHAIDAILYDDGEPFLSDVDILIAAETPNPTPSWQIRLPSYTKDYWMAYPSDGIPEPNPTPTVPWVAYAGDNFWHEKVGKVLTFDYNRRPQTLDAMSSVWVARVIHDATMGPEPGKILTLDESLAKHRPNWCAALGIPVIPYPG